MLYKYNSISRYNLQEKRSRGISSGLQQNFRKLVETAFTLNLFIQTVDSEVKKKKKSMSVKEARKIRVQMQHFFSSVYTLVGT